ncbi:MAG: sulfotransferase [Phycisphaerales bacterium]|nr:sulfotransferase [Phycisphaerales bacterium]
MARNSSQIAAQLKQAAALFEGGRSRQARELASEVLKKEPRNVQALRIFALSAVKSLQWPEGMKAAEKAYKISPNDPNVLATCSTVLIAGGRFDEALARAKTALRVAPNDARAYGNYSECLIWTGQYQACIDLLQKRADAGRLTPGTAATFVAACFELGRYDEAIKAAQGFLDAHGDTQPPVVTRPLYSLLGRSLEKAGLPAEAVIVFEKMNGLVEGRYDPVEADRLTDRLISAFPAELYKGRGTSPNAESRLPVFIIGLARSGTSLTERVVGAHPDAHGVGETTLLDEVLTTHLGEVGANQAFMAAEADDVMLERIRTDYLRGLQLQGGRSKQRIANKSLMLPRQAGIIGLLFPNATILFTERDLHDTAISIWANIFDPIRMAWTTRLDWIGTIAAMHQRMMKHWMKSLPNPMLTVNYRDLAKNPAETVPGIIEACGLPWDDACLSPEKAATEKKSGRFAPTLSEQQLRRPINTSAIGRAEAFTEKIVEFQKGFDSIRKD